MSAVQSKIILIWRMLFYNFFKGEVVGRTNHVCVCVCTCACMHAHALSGVQLFGTPQTAAHQAPLSMGFPRQKY